MSSLGLIVNKEKIGNLIIYLAERIKPLYHTKLIKLLYFIDEYAVKDSGIPITWLEYKVWEKGPVAPETFFLKTESNVFRDFITTKQHGENSFIICPIKAFDDSCFSDYDFEVIDTVVSELADKNAEYLIKLSHQKGSLWSDSVEKNKIDFSHSNSKTTNYNLDFFDLVKNDPEKSINYREALEIALFNQPS